MSVLYKVKNIVPVMQEKIHFNGAEPETGYADNPNLQHTRNFSFAIFFSKTYIFDFKQSYLMISCI